MNKKLNTALFFLVATIVNILIVMILAIASLVLYSLLIAPLIPEAAKTTANLLALLIIVVGSMVGSFPLYRMLVDWFQKKVDVEKYFDPLVRSGRRGRRN